MKALKFSPSFIKFTVSSMKVEKVVKAPQKPTIRRSLALGLKRNFSSESAARKPMRRQPIRLTVRVP